MLFYKYNTRMTKDSRKMELPRFESSYIQQINTARNSIYMLVRCVYIYIYICVDL